MKLVERRRAEEAQLEAWAAQPGNPGFGDVLPEIRAISLDRREAFPAEFLLENLSHAGNLLPTAIDLVRRAREAKKPDLERLAGYMDRDAKRLRDRLERRLRDYDSEVDVQVLAALLVRVAALPERSGIPALALLTAGTTGKRDAFVLAARTLISASKLADKEATLALLAADEETLARSEDPLLVLARELVPGLEALDARNEARTGRGFKVGPRYFTMLRTLRKGPVYPDANGTLRFSYAKIEGYSPREALIAAPQTTLAGQMAKVTGETPFDMPARIVDIAGAAAAELPAFGVDLDWYTVRERDELEVLPWDHLDSGLDKEWLWSDWQEALAEQDLDDCRWIPCFDCGVCPQMGTEIQIGPTGKTLLPLTVVPSALAADPLAADPFAQV